MVLDGTSAVQKPPIVVATTLPTNPKVNEICVVVGDLSTDRGMYVCFEEGTWIQVF